MNPLTNHILRMGSKVAGPTDPYWANVKLLAFNDNAPNGTTTFLDQAGHSTARLGNAVYTNTNPPAGMTTCVLFDGSAANVNSPFSTDWKLGPSDWTLDATVRISTLPVNASQIILQHWGNGGIGQEGWIWTIGNSGGSTGITFFYSITGWSYYTASITWNPVANTDYRLRLVSFGGVLHFYVDGVRIGTLGMVGTDIHLSASPVTLTIGGGSVGDSPFVGRMTSVRLTSGIARSTGATYTLESLPFPSA